MRRVLRSNRRNTQHLLQFLGETTEGRLRDVETLCQREAPGAGDGEKGKVIAAAAIIVLSDKWI